MHVSGGLALTSCCPSTWQGLEVEAQTAVLAMKEAERSAAASKAKAALDELQVSGAVSQYFPFRGHGLDAQLSIFSVP